MQFVTKARLAKQPLFLWMAPTLPHSPDRFRQYLAEWPTPCMDGEPNPDPDPNPDLNPHPNLDPNPNRSPDPNPDPYLAEWPTPWMGGEPG